MATNQPRQKRSRERVEKIMLAAADELAKTADANALTTTSVSKRSGVPVATIYRYFADRSAIISALIDRETTEIDDVVAKRLEQLETITFDTLLQTIMYAHLDHFQASRRSIVLWFGARNSKEVLGRVERRYRYLGKWLMDGAIASGMATPESPPWGGEAIVWVCDRGFEFMFRENRTPETEREIMEITMTMIRLMLVDYSTELGTEGVSREVFREHFGPYIPPSGSTD
ncbi:MAG: TetR/AcrR family transcriptional regulator [Solirubrobacterales bacterium]